MVVSCDQEPDTGATNTFDVLLSSAKNQAIVDDTTVLSDLSQFLGVYAIWPPAYDGWWEFVGVEHYKVSRWDVLLFRKSDGVGDSYFLFIAAPAKRKVLDGILVSAVGNHDGESGYIEISYLREADSILVLTHEYPATGEEAIEGEKESILATLFVIGKDGLRKTEEKYFYPSVNSGEFSTWSDFRSLTP